MIKAIVVQGTSIAKFNNLKFSIKIHVQTGFETHVLKIFTVCFIFYKYFCFTVSMVSCSFLSFVGSPIALNFHSLFLL
jgi:hypothetical protein